MLGKYDKDKVVRDIKECIKTLSGFDQSREMKQTIGVLRRCAFDLEGIDNIWTEDMTDYQKVERAIEMGFDIQTKWPDGLMVEYVGYHFWGFTDDELESLRRLSAQKGNRHDGDYKKGGDTA